MAVSLVITGVQFPDNSIQTTRAAQVPAFTNRIINGAMVIDQRNAGAQITIPNGSSAYPVDRFQVFKDTSSGVFYGQQSTTAPTGFYNSMLLTANTAWTPATGDLAVTQHKIEAFNTSDLAFGSASAATVTLSFWVRSSITGTYSVALINSANNRSYVATYTISAANTFEQKTITIAGDTAGTWINNTNGTGIRVNFDLGSNATYNTTAGAWAAGFYTRTSGSVNWTQTSGATFYVTGVQLEKGSTATSFDYRPYGIELRLCQRYYYRTVSGGTSFPLSNVGGVFSTTQARALTTFPVRMRTTPAALEQSGTASDYAILQTTAAVTCSSVPTFNAASLDSAYTDFTIASGGSTGSYAMIRGTVSTAYLGWSAEL
jgi:hypothetical protein